MTTRVMFCPWSAGSGAGYTGRCLAAAMRLGATFDCAFGPSGMAVMVAEAGMRRVGPPEVGVPTMRAVAYLPFTDLERVYAVAARYFRAEALRRDLTLDLAAVDEFRPDLLVTDMRPTAVIAARLRGLPVVSLADTDFLATTPNPWMPWAPVDGRPPLPHPDCLGTFNGLLAEHGMPSVGNVSELLWGDLTLIPSSPVVEPPPEAPTGRADPVYVGPLYWDPPEPRPMPRAEPGKTCVYVSIGSGGMVGDAALSRILDALDMRGLSVFVSAGLRQRDLSAGRHNVEVGGFTGLSGPLAWADLVIDHGGYSTVIASLLHGRPQVVLPFMSEQEANGRAFLAERHAGLLARTTEVGHDGNVHYLNRHGERSADSLVPTGDLRLTVEEALSDLGLPSRARYAADDLALRRAESDLAELFRGVLT